MISSTKLSSLLILTFGVISVQSEIAKTWSKPKRSFVVDYENGVFLKDGEPFQYISAGIHYFRILPYYWRDRLQKAKASGVDAIEMYLPWNFHQTSLYTFEFDGAHDVVKFIKTAQEVGLLVIIRGFPYSDTEWDLGGLPSWLLRSDLNDPKNPIKLRSHDQRFVGHTYNWLSVILPKLQPLLYSNGGPVIMIQIENEFGSYASDPSYLESLYNIMYKYYHDSVLFFTTDGNQVISLKHGRINGTLQTCDFGAGGSANSSFAALLKTLPKGPHVNSEFYTGWLDHWGESHHRVPTSMIIKTLNSMLYFNASVNFYMFHGGTNFGYWAGANMPSQQITTSYDYDAPLSEAGDTTDKYSLIRNEILKFKNLNPEDYPVPPNSKKMKYGPIAVQNIGNIFQFNLLRYITKPPVKSENPLTFDDLDTMGGFVLHEIDLNITVEKFSLIFENSISDEAQVIINRAQSVGDLPFGAKMINITLQEKITINKISLLVRSKGHICFGSGISDLKGIYGPVSISVDGASIKLLNWINYGLDFDKFFGSGYFKDMKNKLKMPKTQNVKDSVYEPLLPSMYMGSLSIDAFHDTFVDMSDGGWVSGYLFVNGFNLGYYEPKSGPQLTLYAPLPAILQEQKYLNAGHIDIFIFEYRAKYMNSNVFLTDVHNIG